MVKTHKYLTEIENYKPGKSKIQGQAQDFTKLSSNENALKSSPKALEAYKLHASDLFRYADGGCTELREALAEKNAIDANRIVCGAGSDENLALLTAAYAGIGDEVIYSKHGFLMYPISAKRVGALPIQVPERNLKADIDAILAAISPKTKIIFIANPNNPTGSYLSAQEINKLIAGVPKSVLIVLDHAYEEFAAPQVQDYPNALKLVEENENVVVTRTFSKIYGLASLRIGWSYSSQAIADILNKIRGPFNVGGPAQFAAIAALKDQDFTQKSQAHNKKWLAEFFANAKNFAKIKAYPSIANFILFDFASQENCVKANEEFIAQGFILREMSAYHLPNCLRMTIGTDAENEKALAILKQIDNLLV